ANRHADHTKLIATRCFLNKSHNPRRYRQIRLDEIVVQFVFALDDCLHDLVRHGLLDSSVSGAYESDIIHSQRREIILVREYDAFRLQHLAISFQMNALVIDDDAVEITKDRLDHSQLAYQEALWL